MVLLYEILIGLALVAICAFAGSLWRQAGGSPVVGLLLVGGVLGAYVGPALWRLDWAALAGPGLALLVVVAVVGGYAALLARIRRRARARDEES